jgi:hypothetical protein
MPIMSGLKGTDGSRGSAPEQTALLDAFRFGPDDAGADDSRSRAAGKTGSFAPVGWSHSEGIREFARHPTPAAAPLPAALPLFATGLGVMGLGRRTRPLLITRLGGADASIPRPPLFP